ncbi:MAG TPA: MOSC domain-containing protein [Tepidisphaeraceae bacterium]|nr:MOSC domain-containing protein [Tepidisphaeraceae bacterium]
MRDAILESIQIGRPQNYGRPDAAETHDQAWTTGFFKQPIDGIIFVGRTNLSGDGQADLKHHGGLDKAVLAYSADHYPHWRRELDRPSLPFGAFAENLTISGLDEQTVHIGDVYAVGPVQFEVSQPRQPCWKLARRWRMNELVAMVIANGRTGWYLRVLHEGQIEAGMNVELLRRPNPEWPIARANRILHHHKKDLKLTLQLAAVPHLADAWVNELHERAERLEIQAVAATGSRSSE